MCTDLVMPNLDIEKRCECCRHKRGWWTLCKSELFHRFRTSVKHGLSQHEHEDAQRRCGANHPPELTATPDFWIANSSGLLGGTRIAMLAGLGVLCFGSKTLRASALQRGMLPMGAALAGLSAFGMYISNGLNKKLQQFAKLRDHMIDHPPSAVAIQVTRAGKIFSVKGSELVPGDIVHVQRGQLIPADCRVVEAEDLEVDHTFLPPAFGGVHAVSAAAEQESCPLQGSRCSLFATACVTRGSGTAMVTRIGDMTCPVLVMESLRAVTLDSVLVLLCVDAAWVAGLPFLFLGAIPRLLTHPFNRDVPRTITVAA